MWSAREKDAISTEEDETRTPRTGYTSSGTTGPRTYFAPTPSAYWEGPKGDSCISRSDEQVEAQQEQQGFDTISVEQKVSNEAQVPFVIPKTWKYIKTMGSGAYGLVVSCKRPHGELRKLAVKKCRLGNLCNGKRILREVMVLQFLKNVRHPNLLACEEVYVGHCRYFEDIYMVTPLMECDLKCVIKTDRLRAKCLHQRFLYQILEGLIFLHSAGIIHRDLKPANILVDEDNTLKICDWNLAKGHEYQYMFYPLTDYDIGTPWYRAPEAILRQGYNQTLDIWPVACIFWELFIGQVLFPGRNQEDMLMQICTSFGMPFEYWSEDWELRTLMPPSENSKFSVLDDDARDFLFIMLHTSPCYRATARQAIEHVYLERWYEPEEVKVAPEAMDWSFDRFEPTEDLIRDRLRCQCTLPWQR